MTKRTLYLLSSFQINHGDNLVVNDEEPPTDKSDDKYRVLEDKLKSIEGEFLRFMF